MTMLKQFFSRVNFNILVHCQAQKHFTTFSDYYISSYVGQVVVDALEV